MELVESVIPTSFPENALDAYAQWVNDNGDVEMAKDISPLSNKVLIKLFYHFVPIKSTLILKGKSQIIDQLGRPINIDLGEEDKASNISKLYPIGKILAVGKLTDSYKHLSPGDIVVVEDNLTESRFNEMWIDWSLKKQEDPAFGRKVPEPPLFIGVISKWDQYKYKLNKFGQDIHVKDQFTYLIPESLILAEYQNNG